MAWCNNQPMAKINTTVWPNATIKQFYGFFALSKISVARATFPFANVG
jgi:hypothetical protein